MQLWCNYDAIDCPIIAPIYAPFAPFMRQLNGFYDAIMMQLIVQLLPNDLFFIRHLSAIPAIYPSFIRQFRVINAIVNYVTSGL